MTMIKQQQVLHQLFKGLEDAYGQPAEVSQGTYRSMPTLCISHIDASSTPRTRLRIMPLLNALDRAAPGLPVYVERNEEGGHWAENIHLPIASLTEEVCSKLEANTPYLRRLLGDDAPSLSQPLRAAHGKG